ncbi:MAG: NADH-quinone oxidoreductase subunit NuoK [Thermoanaerobaculaceae bacterium]
MSEAVLGLFFAGFLVFLVGVYLLLSYRNLLRLVLGVEVLAKGVTLVLLAAGAHLGMTALIQSLIVTFIIVETILAAVMLAIIVVCHRTNQSLDVRVLSRLRG